MVKSRTGAGWWRPGRKLTKAEVAMSGGFGTPTMRQAAQAKRARLKR